MIIAMRDIASLLEQHEEKEVLQKLITLYQTIFKVIVLRIEKKGDWEYMGASILDYDSDDATKFLYRKGPSNGPSTTPAALITEAKKTIPKKILAWFDKLPKPDDVNVFKEDIEYIREIGCMLKQSEKKIITDVTTLCDKIDRSKGNILLSLEIVDGKREYIGNSQSFVNIFLELVKRRYYNKYGSTSKGFGTCYVCNTQQNVFGFVTDVFSFYTLDKRGFAPGLDVADGWKSFPVCFDCALALETSKQFLDENLHFNFYGAKYYLIPKTIAGSTKVLDEVVSVFSGQDKKISIADSSNRLTDDENEILHGISTLSDSVVLNFLFYYMEQSSMRILGYMEDVLPSRISRIFSFKERLENTGLYHEFGVTFTFYILKELTGRRDAQDYKEFMSVTGKILKGQKPDRKLLLNRILTNFERIRNEFGIKSLMGRKSLTEKRRRLDNVLRSMMLVEFFEISDDGGVTKKMNNTQEQTREEIVKGIMDAHPSFFITHSQKVAFLIGLLTGRLLAIQGYERGSSPFEKKLHNLRFSIKRLQRLYVEVEMKLKAYGHSNTYKTLEQLLSEEVMSAANEKVDNDELSLCFVIGLNQSYKLRSTKGDEE